MRRAALMFAGAALLASVAYGGEGNVRRSARRVPGQYIVVLESGTDAAALASTVRNLKNARVKHTYQRGVKGFALEMSDADAQVLAQDSRVQFVEEDSLVSAAQTTWALDRVDQRLLPLDGTYVSDGTGAGVNVFVVDTGILADHADLSGRVAAGFSAFEDNNSSDCNGHGTHVAGVVGGSSHGVAKSATLVPVRVLDCNGSGTISTVLAGLDWVLAEHARAARPSVVNMSLGGDASSAFDAQVDRLLAAGLTAVVAAGNSNRDACRTSPARVTGALTVGATTETDQRASFSNYGACVDLFAPGQNILSSWYSSPNATAVTSGTSAAAPFVAGAAALVLERYPDASPNTVNQTLLTQATADVLTSLGDGSPNRLLYSLIGSRDDSVRPDSQLLADPSFEYGTTFWSLDICTVVNPAGCTANMEVGGGWGGGWGWGDSGDINLQSHPSRSGKNRAALGGAAKSFDLESESVTISSNVRRAELSVHLWVVTKNKKASVEDVLTVEIRDASGKLLETLRTFSNLDASATYGQHRFDVSRHRGATIRVSFKGVQGSGPPTWFLLDDVALNIWR